MSAESLSHSLRKVTRLQRLMRAHFYQNNGDLHLLHIMEKKYPDGVTPSRLSKDFGLALPTISQKLSELEELSMIDRLPCAEDRRKTLVRVSRQGKQNLEEKFKDFMSRWDRVYSRLGREKAEELSALLEELRRAISRETEEAEQ